MPKEISDVKTTGDDVTNDAAIPACAATQMLRNVLKIDRDTG